MSSLSSLVDAGMKRRVQRLADARGWDLQKALTHVLELGLAAENANPTPAWSNDETDAFAQAVAAMQQVPDDPGFALIGRVPGIASAD